MSAQGTDVAILTAVAGASAAGVYGAVNKWTQPMGLLVNAYASASVPHVARASTARDAWAAIRRGVWLLALAALGCAAVAVSAPWLVPTLVGSQYAGAVVVLQILALAVLPAILNQPLASFLQSRGYEKLVARTTIAATLAQLALVIVLGSALGAVGAALSLGVAQLLILTGLSIVALRLRGTGGHGA